VRLTGCQLVQEIWLHLIHAKLFSVLLLAAICLPFLSISNVSSQMSGTVTTTTIKTPPAGQCSVLALPFSSPVHSVVSGEFTADVTIDFYILSQSDFASFTQSGNCALPGSANPLFVEVNVMGAYNQYSSIPIPANGTYLFVFVYRNNGLTHITSGYATVNLSFPSFVSFITIGASSSTIVMTFFTSILTSSTTPEFTDWSGWLVLVLLTGLVGAVLRRRKKILQFPSR